jgi:hypothetical protein
MHGLLAPTFCRLFLSFFNVCCRYVLLKTSSSPHHIQGVMFIISLKSDVGPIKKLQLTQKVDVMRC